MDTYWPMNLVNSETENCLANGELSANDLDDLNDLFRRFVPPMLEKSVGWNIPLAPWDEADNLTFENKCFR